jgi:hypothetical protein
MKRLVKDAGRRLGELVIERDRVIKFAPVRHCIGWKIGKFDT